MNKTVFLAIGRWLTALAILALLAGFLLRAPAADAPFAQIRQAVLSAADLNDTVEADEQMVRRLYGIDPSVLDGCVLFCPSSNMDARELLLVRVRDETQREAVQAAIQARIETQKAAFDGYAAEQYDLMVNHSAVETAGSTILFVVGASSADTVRAFRAAAYGRAS